MIKHTQVYDRHSTISTATVLEAIGAVIAAQKTGKKLPKTLINCQPVNTKSLRLQTFFTKGLVCAKCGRVGTHFAIERTSGHNLYHLNLWSTDENGDEYLMTHDHILARSLGGADNLSNTQTMCSPCNHEKSLVEREELARRKSSPAVLIEDL